MKLEVRKARAAAIAANLAKGYILEDAVRTAKAFLSGALADGLDLGKGAGPMNHAFDIKDSYKAVRS